MTMTDDVTRPDCPMPTPPLSAADSTSSTSPDFTLQRVAGRAIGTVADLIALGSATGSTAEYLVVLDVHDAARDASWTAVHHQRLSPATLPDWQPGRRVPVLFDPYDRERVLAG